MKCPKGKEGDGCFGKEFKNQHTLKMHLAYKHQEAVGSDTDSVADSDLSKADLGLGDPPVDPKGDEPKVLGTCSECSAVIHDPMPDACSNCGVAFDEGVINDGS